MAVGFECEFQDSRPPILPAGTRPGTQQALENLRGGWGWGGGGGGVVKPAPRTLLRTDLRGVCTWLLPAQGEGYLHIASHTYNSIFYTGSFASTNDVNMMGFQETKLYAKGTPRTSQGETGSFRHRRILRFANAASCGRMPTAPA